MTELPDSPVAPALSSLCELFTTELREVRFPDVDGASLASAVNAVHTAAAELARAEAVVEAARQTLADSQEALLHRGQRALAYARIFAEDNPALQARLDGLQLQRGVRRGARLEAAATAPAATAEPTVPRRRGRPPKAATAETGLFMNGEGSTIEATLIGAGA
ncbi:MAG: hypothetical protein L0Y66_09530 [Myxococcaceae bacterium]|nr:hypothetical protein [Myxococcaceae bacterium]MCI0669050.1 hypothetical protein [Myxococcaceae bacterium]